MSNESGFILIGASLDTGNLGVSALLTSIVQCLHSVYPDISIRLLEGIHNPVEQQVRFSDEQLVTLGNRVGVRCNKTLWRPNHIVHLLVRVIIARLLPPKLRLRWLNKNPYTKAVVSASAVMDITGGDSFSDIYGIRRLFFSCLNKFFILLSGIDLVLLPQTYGPFNGFLSKVLARTILARAAKIYSRDLQSLEQIRNLMGNKKMRTTPQLCPDVAFVLNGIRPKTEQINKIEKMKAEGQTLIGLNISGLLYNGGYTRNNMFGLQCDYPSVIKKIIFKFIALGNYYILLVPHVIPPKMPVENDLDACRSVYQDLSAEVQNKVLVLDGDYDQNEIKYLIGRCDFFMGARMHATIAALSQCIPAVGMAYSKKFFGVYETVGMSDYVLDMRNLNESEIIERIEELCQNKAKAIAILKNTIPAAQQKVFSIFENLH